MTEKKSYTPSEGQRREAVRNRGFQDGRMGRPKASTEPEYLTSYRRGKEEREKS